MPHVTYNAILDAVPCVREVLRPTPLHQWPGLSRLRGAPREKPLLSAWPLSRRPGWAEHVNTPQTESELAALRRSVQRGCSYGEADWSDRMVAKLGLQSTLRPPGRPQKHKNGS